MIVNQAKPFFRDVRGGSWGCLDGSSDCDLLDAYVLYRDEAAFEALVRRHGPMLQAVCWRILENAEDVEDAVQSTFLVLVRKASIIHPASKVGHWLYGVAYRTALAARHSAALRRAKESRVPPRIV
jgi:DNA-directed RNA polymerase specialized sigma24 family protein